MSLKFSGNVTQIPWQLQSGRSKKKMVILGQRKRNNTGASIPLGHVPTTGFGKKIRKWSKWIWHPIFEGPGGLIGVHYGVLARLVPWQAKETLIDQSKSKLNEMLDSCKFSHPDLLTELRYLGIDRTTPWL